MAGTRRPRYFMAIDPTGAVVAIVGRVRGLGAAGLPSGDSLQMIWLAPFRRTQLAAGSYQQFAKLDRFGRLDVRGKEQSGAVECPAAHKLDFHGFPWPIKADRNPRKTWRRQQNLSDRRHVVVGIVFNRHHSLPS